jgi:DNA polymerase III epsilon subunit family exonuclease
MFDDILWDDIPILAMDTETTGFGSHDRIVELGMVLLEGDQIVDEYQTFLNPGFPMPEAASKVNGITDDMLEDAPQFEDVQDDVLDWLCRGAPWVAHNASFDMRMLSYNLPVARWPVVPTLCTLEKARSRGHKRARLEVLASYFKVEQKEAHRAVDDARVCGLIARQMTKGLPILDYYTKLSNKWNF